MYPSSTEEMLVSAQRVSCGPLALFYFKMVKVMPNPKEQYSSPARSSKGPLIDPVSFVYSNELLSNPFLTSTFL